MQLLHYEWIVHSVSFRVIEASKHLQHFFKQIISVNSFGSSRHPNTWNINGTNNIRQFFSGHRGIIIVSKFRPLYNIWVTIHSLEKSLRHPNTCKIYGTNNIRQFFSGHRGIIIVSKFRPIHYTIYEWQFIV